MFKTNNSSNDSNFWISYADLMAGLLFVFILLIGAIVSKSITLREHLLQQKRTLAKTLHALDIKESKLGSLNKKVQKQVETIKTQQKRVQQQVETIKLQQDEIYKLKSFLEKRMSDLNATKEVLRVTKDALDLKENELKKLNQLLLEKNSKIDSLNGKVVILQNLLQESNTTVAQKSKSLDEYKNRVLILSNELTQKSNELNITNKKMLNLLTALDEKRSNYETLVKELQSKRAKIKYLTGIKLRIIDELKTTLGSRVKVTKDGALKLSSKILFDKGSSLLKDNAKEELKRLFTDYITALMSNKAVTPYIENIVIEGHTDSDGGFLYNLKLSQERALSVMNYLLTLPVTKKYNLKKYLTASGRSYLDKIEKDGVEDKEASRRIEIKFRLKNQNAFYEIEKVLDENNSF